MGKAAVKTRMVQKVHTRVKWEELSVSLLHRILLFCSPPLSLPLSLASSTTTAAWYAMAGVCRRWRCAVWRCGSPPFSFASFPVSHPSSSPAIAAVPVSPAARLYLARLLAGQGVVCQRSTDNSLLVPTLPSALMLAWNEKKTLSAAASSSSVSSSCCACSSSSSSSSPCPCSSLCVCSPLSPLSLAFSPKYISCCIDLSSSLPSPPGGSPALFPPRCLCVVQPNLICNYLTLSPPPFLSPLSALSSSSSFSSATVSSSISPPSTSSSSVAGVCGCLRVLRRLVERPSCQLMTFSQDNEERREEEDENETEEHDEEEAAEQEGPMFECAPIAAGEEEAGARSGELCSNRLLQYHQRSLSYPSLPFLARPSFELKWVAGKGWGIYLSGSQPIVKGTFVGEYTGERIARAEARKRRRSWYDPLHLNYILTVRERWRVPLSNKHSKQQSWQGRARGKEIEEDSKRTVEGEAQEHCLSVTRVDGTRYGNMTRYLNHSCQPCLEIHLVRTDDLTLPLPSTAATVASSDESTSLPPAPSPWLHLPPSICFFASRHILPGEELTFSYGRANQTSSSREPLRRGAKRPRDEEEKEKKEEEADKEQEDAIGSRLQLGRRRGAKIACLCGAERCQRWLPCCSDSD